MNSNYEVGKKFRQTVMIIAEKKFGVNFNEEYPMPVGKPAKDYRFSCVSLDKKIVIVCKCYTWTKGNNVPNAKISTLNEIVGYMNSLPVATRKIIAMKKDIRERTSETLAGYYYRIHGDLLKDIEIWEINDAGDMTIIGKEDI